MSADASNANTKKYTLGIMNYTGALFYLLYLEQQPLFEELYLINSIINKEQLNNLILQCSKIFFAFKPATMNDNAFLSSENLIKLNANETNCCMT